MRQLFVVTHPESAHHVERRVGGWYDTSLTEQGRRNARHIAEQLVVLAAGQSAEIIASDLKRTAETAAVIGARLGVPSRLDPDLREMRYGEAEGKPQAWLDERAVPPPDADQLDYRIIPSAESRREVATRVYRALEAILARPVPTQIVVTHGFSLSMVVAGWIGMPLESVGRVAFPVRSGSITHLMSDDRWHNRGVRLLGETRHLD